MAKKSTANTNPKLPPADKQPVDETGIPPVTDKDSDIPPADKQPADETGTPPKTDNGTDEQAGDPTKLPIANDVSVEQSVVGSRSMSVSGKIISADNNEADKPEDDTESEAKTTFTVHGCNIRHNGRTYKEGSNIELTDEEAARLKKYLKR
jgi:hypothetical protein